MPTGDPGLPIKLGPCSNGEIPPLPPGPISVEAARRARVALEDTARRVGMTRRRFLLSSMGAATTLAVLAACADDAREATGGGEPGGTFSVPPEATTEPEAAVTTLAGGGDAIVDVQNHLLEFPTPPGAEFFGAGFPQAGCGDADEAACFDIDHWLDLVFAQSDTTVAVLSAIPVIADADDDPLSAAVMERARVAAERICGDGRVLVQGHAVPNVGPLDDALAAMDDARQRYPIAAWKIYTSAGPGWFLDDHDGGAAQIGAAFLERVVALGVPIVAVHKGLSGGSRFASPVDIGPAALAHPNLAFVVYHSGFEGGGEGPYDPDGAGADRLVRTLADAGLGPGANVYAELGSTWRAVMGDPDQAAHLLGKLLLAVGEDNVLWGTDSIWYGSPQDQIAAFRAFEITPAFQDRFGYPALSPAVKAKILGGNAARLYGIDPATVPCRFTPAEREAARQESALGNRPLGPVTAAAAAAVWRREHPWFRRGAGRR